MLAERDIPYVGSLGALDMVNWGARDTVPAKFRDRNLYVHNPQVTLMRTTPEECAQMGAWIGRKLSAARGPVRFLIPEGGVSLLDARASPFTTRRPTARFSTRSRPTFNNRPIAA